jgi:glycerate 2-kinase
MKVVVAIDSLKGSLSSIEAGQAIKKGILKACEAEVVVKPLADGGEGTVESLVMGMGGIEHTVTVTGPLGEQVGCVYGVLEQSNTAIIEIAGAAGIILVPDELKNPLKTTTYGVGEVIKEGIKQGCRNFIIGIGGSVTNDAGVGMLQALGFEFYDEDMKKVGFGGEVLSKIKHIKTDNKLSELDECDVNNPLYGKEGAAYVYGPQKGATTEIVEELDLGLRSYSEVVKKEFGIDIAKVSGTGAAGGLGYAFLGFLDANLESGIKIILDEINLEEEIIDADYVITGEGKLDFQTAMGKAPIGVAKLAKKYGKKVIAFSGCVTEDAVKCNDEGIDAYFSIVNTAMSLSEAMDKDVARKNMIETTTQVFSLIKAVE